jgi:thioredoxin 1
MINRFSMILLLALGVSGCDPIKKSVLQTDKSVEKLAVAMNNRAGGAGAIQNLTAGDFDAFIGQSGKLVVVDFYADRCGLCQQLAPLLDKLAVEYGDRVSVGKVNVDECGEIAKRADVEQYPDLRMYRDGRQVDQIVGLPAESELRSRIERHSKGAEVTKAKDEKIINPSKPKQAAKPKEQAIQPMGKDWVPPGLQKK